MLFRSRAWRLSLVLLSLLSFVALRTSAQEAYSTATVIDQVYVRSAPSTNDPILAELHAGDEVTIHGETSNGFISIIHGEYIGWVYMDYLEFPDGEGPTSPPDPTTPQETPEPTSIPVTPIPTEVVTPEPTAAVTPEPTEEVVVPAPETGNLIQWPVMGGEWEVLQGYNGSSHQNQTDLWQYRDSLDLVRSDGDTAGAQVYSPVNGTVKWFDPSTGGVSIDMGNGYAVAMFHVTFDGSIQEGDTVYQGQPMGTISGPGGPGYASTPHVHIAVWQTSDGGNWNRVSVPFEGNLSINGISLPNTGFGYQHTGLTFNP